MLRLMGNTFPQNNFFFKIPIHPIHFFFPPTYQSWQQQANHRSWDFLPPTHLQVIWGNGDTFPSQLRDLISLVNPGSTSGFPSGRIPKPSTRMYPGGITCRLPPKNQQFLTLIDNIRKKKPYVTVESIFNYLLHFFYRCSFKINHNHGWKMGKGENTSSRELVANLSLITKNYLNLLPTVNRLWCQSWICIHFLQCRFDFFFHSFSFSVTFSMFVLFNFGCHFFSAYISSITMLLTPVLHFFGFLGVFLSSKVCAHIVC